jgi:tRNA-specific adenosine deaminase 2
VSAARALTTARPPCLQGIRHAEFIAIDKLLEQHEGDVDAAGFPRCELYVTCEPCIMCAGALSLMGFGAVTYGCLNDKFGGNGGIISVSDLGCGTCTPAAGPSAAANGAAPPLPGGRGGPYRTRRGLLAEEAVKLLQDFYIAGNPNGARLPRLHHRPAKAARWRRNTKITPAPCATQRPSRTAPCASTGEPCSPRRWTRTEQRRWRRLSVCQRRPTYFWTAHPHPRDLPWRPTRTFISLTL